MADDIVWEDPPEKVGGPGSQTWAMRLAPLKEHPGKWANLGRRHTATRTYIPNGAYSGIKPGEFEAQGVDVKGGQLTLFVRYVGPES